MSEKNNAEMIMPRKYTLAYAITLAINEEPGITTNEIAKTIGEAPNLVSATLKNLLTNGKITRKKEGASYRYYSPYARL